MKIKSIRKVGKLRNQRVLMRVDFNVPLGDDGMVDETEDYRLVRSLPTIKYLTKKGVKLIIVAHLGRPRGKVVEELRMDPVTVRLAQLLKTDIYKSDCVVGPSVRGIVNRMRPGEILMLENVRFHKGEEKGSKIFAKQLASLADIYVNDAFAVDHRNHASTATIQNYLPSYAGFLLEEEVENLSELIEKPKKPLVAIIGGAKVSTKIKVIRKFLEVADHVLLGGALANTVLKAMGISVGKSLIEPKMISTISMLLVMSMLTLSPFCRLRHLKPLATRMRRRLKSPQVTRRSWHTRAVFCARHLP